MQTNVHSPKLRFLIELTLNIGLGIYVQRIGDRCNDFKVSHEGRMKFFKLFLFLIYQEGE